MPCVLKRCGKYRTTSSTVTQASSSPHHRRNRAEKTTTMPKDVGHDSLGLLVVLLSLVM